MTLKYLIAVRSCSACADVGAGACSGPGLGQALWWCAHYFFFQIDTPQLTQFILSQHCWQHLTIFDLNLSQQVSGRMDSAVHGQRDQPYVFLNPSSCVPRFIFCHLQIKRAISAQVWESALVAIFYSDQPPNVPRSTAFSGISPTQREHRLILFTVPSIIRAFLWNSAIPASGNCLREEI